MENNTNLLDLIEKEQELNASLELYKSINNEYKSTDQLNNVEKRTHFNNLLNNLLDLNQKISYQVLDVKSLRNSLSDYNINVDANKLKIDTNLKNVMNDIEKNTAEIIKNKQLLDDYDGSSKEFSKIFDSKNIKYFFSVLVVIVLIFSIIKSISVPYHTNLEKLIFTILTSVTIYHIRMFVTDKIKHINFNKYKPHIFDTN
jgi:multidrug efflux pump subunit AcrB